MLLLRRKLPCAACFGAFQKDITALATGLIRSAGILLSVKAVRFVTLPPEKVPVSGSKILILLVYAEKSPFLRAAVGTQMLLASNRGRESLMLSYEKKKKLLFFPFYTFGILIGPPRVRPGRFEKLYGLPWPWALPKKSLAAQPPGSSQ